MHGVLGLGLSRAREVQMSDSEARERRRAKILASKEDRMAKIVGSYSNESSESVNSAKEQKPVPKSNPKPNIKPALSDATSKANNLTSPVSNEATKSQDKNHAIGLTNESLHESLRQTSIKHTSPLLHQLILLLLASIVVIAHNKLPLWSKFLPKFAAENDNWLQIFMLASSLASVQLLNLKSGFSFTGLTFDIICYLFYVLTVSQLIQ